MAGDPFHEQLTWKDVAGKQQETCLCVEMERRRQTLTFTLIGTVVEQHCIPSPVPLSAFIISFAYKTEIRF